jgi:DNA-binding NtrC family response regulator
MFHIIDDEPALREFVETIIDDAGFSSRSFESAEDYLYFVHSANFEKPTAILSDVSMLGMTGYDLVLEIRKIYPLQKIVLITGNVDDAHIQHVEKHLCYSLAKPFLPEKLIDLVTSLHTCEAAYKNNPSEKTFQGCEFSIDHSCPFH